MTALCTIAGRDVSEARIVAPRIGRWTVDAVVLGEEPLAARAELRAGQLTLTGTPIRQGARRGAVHVRLAGGAGGLSRMAPLRHWQDVPLRLPFGDLLAAAGEAVAATSSREALNLRLPRWTTQAQPISVAVSGLASYADAAWRTLPSGAIWIGRETWPEVDPVLDILEELPEEGRIDAGAAAPPPELWPGTTWRGSRVQRVEHLITSEAVSTSAWYLTTPADDLQLIARAALAGPPPWGAGVDYLARYEATVEAQSADGRRVDVRPDAPHVPPMPGIPLRLGLPGCTTKVAAGARVLIAWADGDPALPYVAAWAGGETVSSMELVPGGGAAVRVGDLGAAGTLTIAGQITWTYVEPDGVTTQTGAGGTPIHLKTKATNGSSKVTIG